MSASEVAIRVGTNLEAVREPWQRLAGHSENVFSTWEWARAWRRHIGADKALRIVEGRRPGDDAPFALVPLYLDRTWPVRLVRFVGSGVADQLGPVCDARDRQAASNLTGVQVRGVLNGAGVFVGERLLGENPWASEMDATLVRQASSPVLMIDGHDFEGFLASRSRNFRSQSRRYERALARDHKLVYRLTREPGELESDMRTLIDLHCTRWGAQSTAFAGPRRAFHLDFARQALQCGWLRLWTMELDDVPVAAWYGFRYSGIESFFQSGRLPRLERMHLGTVLLCHTIRCACEDGMREYRFGLGGERYKGRFTEQDPGLSTVAIGTGARGTAALTAVRGYPRLPEKVRSRMRSWPGRR